MYDPTIGQFLSEDPIEFEGLDENLRRYVRNQPTGYTDPTGLAPFDLGDPSTINTLMTPVVRPVIDIPITYVDATSHGMTIEKVWAAHTGANEILSQAGVRLVTPNIVRPDNAAIEAAIGADYRLQWNLAFFKPNPRMLPPEANALRALLPKNPGGIVVFLVDRCEEVQPNGEIPIYFGFAYPPTNFDGMPFITASSFYAEDSVLAETVVHELVHLAGDPSHVQGTITGPQLTFGGIVRAPNRFSQAQIDALRQNLSSANPR